VEVWLKEKRICLAKMEGLLMPRQLLVDSMFRRAEVLPLGISLL
jgi:hypothetical protein